MRKKNWTFVFMFILMALLFSHAFAQKQKSAARPEILDEVAIMKSVLKEMFSKDKNDFWDSNSVEAVYFPDYGMVFSINSNWGDHFLILNDKMIIQTRVLQASEDALKAQEQLLKTLSQSLGENHAKQVDRDSLRKHIKKLKETIRQRLGNAQKDRQLSQESLKQQSQERLKQFKKRIEKTVKSLQDFLENYADVGDLLPPNQRITVFFNDHSSSSVISVPMFYSVKKSDILSFRSGKITKDQFWARVQKGAKPSEEIQKQLEIMKRILKTGLKTVSTYSWGTREIEAHVLPGYGVWFNLGNAQIGPPSISFSFASGKSVQVKNDPKRQKAIRKYYGRIIQLIGQYGFSLRFLKPDERVVATFHSNGFLNRFGPHLYFLRVKKTNIEELHKKKITFRDFQRRVEWQEFR